jgi:hypothetical protein
MAEDSFLWYVRFVADTPISRILAFIA